MQLGIFAEPAGSCGKTSPARSAPIGDETLLSWLERWQVLDATFPPRGWGNEGAIVGQEGLVEWATLDAQWFGVAQRRRRVFALLDSGDWSGRPPVLLEPEGMRGDSAPRREAGEGTAPSLAARTRGGGGLGTDRKSVV